MKYVIVRYDTYCDYPTVIEYGDDYIAMWGEANEQTGQADNFERFIVVPVDDLCRIMNLQGEE